MAIYKSWDAFGEPRPRPDIILWTGKRREVKKRRKGSGVRKEGGVTGRIGGDGDGKMASSRDVVRMS